MPHTPRSISAADLLSSYDLSALQQIARKRGIDAKGKSKTALVPLLAPSLYSPEAIAAALTDLEPVEREALNYLILAGGEALTTRIRDQLVAAGQVDRPAPYIPRIAYGKQQSGKADVRGSRDFPDIIARLGALGLAFSLNSSSKGKNAELGIPGEYLFIPEAIQKHLPGVEVPVETVEPPPAVLPAVPADLLRDIYVLLSFARQQPIPLTARGLLPKRNLVQIDSALRQPENAASVRSELDLGRLPFLRALLEQRALLTMGAGALRLGGAAAEFLAQAPGERRKALYRAYRETQRWSELSRLPSIQVWPKERLGSMVTSARNRVLTELAELPAEEWIALDHLIARIRAKSFEFLFSRSRQQSRYAAYYYGSSYEPDPYEGDNALGLTFESSALGQKVDWDSVEGGFIRSMVTEALHWLGIVDLSSSSADGPASAFRITRDGSVLLRGGMPLSPMPEPHVVIQPNFQVFAFEPTGEDVLFTLDTIGERVRAEHAIEYQLSRESVYAGQEQGMEIADILAFLDRVSAAPLPQNVRRSLEEWGAQHERIVIRRASLVHTIDEATLDALYADPAVRPLLGRRLSPTAASAAPENINAIYAHLMKTIPAAGQADSGHRHPIPAISEGNDNYPRPALTVCPDGRITFRQRVPSIYIQHVLRAFAEEGPKGSMHMTPATLRQAASKHDLRGPLQPDDIIATLERFHLGPLPVEATKIVRRWAKDWGRGSLTNVALLEVENEQIMADLLADEEIAPYLHAVPGSSTLAIVRADGEQPASRLQARLRTLLRDRGMDLEDGTKGSQAQAVPGNGKTGVKLKSR